MNAKTKKILTGVGALALTAAISITGTVAYLTHITEQRANNFTFETEGLDAMLTEPKWDGVVGYKYVGNKIYPTYGKKDGKIIWGYTDGDPNKPVTNDEEGKGEEPPANVDELLPPKTYKDESVGYLEAKKMVPGRVANKDPMITNTGKMDEWVAAKVTFVYGEDSKDAGKPIPSETVKKDIMPVIEIDWGTTTADTTSVADGGKKWYLKEGAPEGTFDGNNYTDQMTFYYDTALDTTTGKESTSIFNSIKLADSATTEQVKKLEDMGGFAIWIEGYAVQKSEFENGTAWVGNTDDNKKAVFNNTPDDDHPATVKFPGITGSPDKLTTE